MIKRFNFLGRRRIAQDCFNVVIHDGQPYRFSASFHLPDVGWPQDASVVMDVYGTSSSTVTRFNCGSLGSLEEPKEAVCEGVTGSNLHFNLKVIDRSEKIGRLLGIGHKMLPVTSARSIDAGRRGILPIELGPLGQQLWSLEFRDHDVFLMVNEQVPDLAERLRSDPMIYSIVYPEVIRQILSRAIEENVDVEEAEDRWPYLWLTFGKNLHPERENPPAEDDEDSKEEWVEQVVASFCTLHSLRDKYSHASKRFELAGE